MSKFEHRKWHEINTVNLTVFTVGLVGLDKGAKESLFGRDQDVFQVFKSHVSCDINIKHACMHARASPMRITLNYLISKA